MKIFQNFKFLIIKIKKKHNKIIKMMKMKLTWKMIMINHLKIHIKK